jgi:hypothetical protein
MIVFVVKINKSMVNHQYYPLLLQDALQLHQIDIKDLSQNHIDGKEFENAKPSDGDKQKGAETGKSSSS